MNWRESLVGLAAFLSALLAGGRVRVGVDVQLSAADVEQSHAQLLSCERDLRRPSFRERLPRCY